MNFEGLRIGLIGPLPPPAGGMAGQTQQLADLLRQEGAQVDVLQVNRPYQPGWVGRVPVLRAFFRLLPYLFALWRSAGRVQLFHIMANSGWSWHLFAAPAIWIARWRGIPSVVNYRGGEARGFLERAGVWVLPSLRRCQALIVPSGFLKEVFAAFGQAARIVPNVVNLGRFQPAAALPERPHLVVTRNLEAIYDVATALRAFRIVKDRFPNAHLSVAGSGPERAALEKRVAELGLLNCVSFTGRLDRDGMAQLYRSASLMLNSSTVDNTPNSILEAMAAGVPVVSSAVGGIPYLVKDGQTALLVPPRNPQALAEAASRVLADAALAASLRQNGLDDVAQYAWPAVKAGLLAVYLELTHREGAMPCGKDC